MYFQTPTREMGLKDVCFNEAILSYMKADIYINRLYISIS